MPRCLLFGKTKLPWHRISPERLVAGGLGGRTNFSLALRAHGRASYKASLFAACSAALVQAPALVLGHGSQPWPRVVHTSLYLPEAVHEALREAAFGHQRVRLGRDDCERADPFARSRVLPVFPYSPKTKRRAVLHGDGEGN